jgi:hypothetical protein
MADGSDMNPAQSPRYETPTFDPRGAFAWTLRSGEIARREAERRRNGVANINGSETSTARSGPYETSTFDPRGAFAWTLRSGEIARRERQQRLPDPRQLDVRAAA